MNTDSNPLPQVEVSADGDRMLGYFMASGERISLETKSALLMSTLRVNWTDRVGVRHIAELPVQPLLSRRQADGLVLEVKDMHLTVYSTTKCYEPHAKQDVLYSRFVN